MTALDSLDRDLRIAWRSLGRTPVVTVAAIVSIGLGVAATTSVFSVVDAALFRPPPFERSDRLAILYITRQHPNEAAGMERWSWGRSRLLSERATSFEQVASVSVSVQALTGAEAEPEPVNAEFVSSSYWPALRVRPLIGRAFDASEDAGSGAHPFVIVGYDLWQGRFAGDRALVGRTIGLNGVSLTVVGIAPRGFDGVSGRAQLWLPATMAPRLSYADYLVTNQNFISVVGRLRDGVTLDQARAELPLIGEEIQRELPSAAADPATRFGATAVSVNEARIDPTTRRPMLLLLAAAACLLLLACANVAGLLLGRAVSRQREIAIRIAMGASRGRIVRQLLVESALLAIAGGVLGVLVAWPVATQIVLPRAVARGRNFYGALGEFATPRVDLRVLAFCLALCALTTVAFGLLPSLRATRVDLTRDLKDGAGGGHALKRGHITPRQFIVGLETALAVVLLFCGGLLATSWRRLEATEVGFDRSHLLTFLIRPSEVQYPAPKAPALIERVLAGIQRVPGVEAASVDGCAPVDTGCASSTLYVVGRPVPLRGTAPPVLRHYIGPDHFRVLRVPVLRGREFNAADRAGANHVAIINETAAKRFWPGEDPIGKRVWFGGGSTFDRPDSSAEIVGIVGDVLYQPLDQNPLQSDFYTPYAQFTYASRMVLVRTLGDPTAAVADLRRAVRAVDPNLALFEVRTLEDRMRGSWARVSYQTRLLAAFAIVALLLAGTGIFAVVSHAISDRRREIGVRVALGATAARVIVTVGDRGARPAIAGLVIGLGVAVATGRALAASLYGVRSFDPTVIVVVATTSALVILVAVYLAARRALDVDAAEALRHQ